MSNPRFIDGSDLGDSRRRKAFVVDLKVGKFDCLLIVVHLKSGRGADDQKIRDEQAKVIGQYIKELREQSREDILLVGDFNMIPGQDISNFHHLGGDDLMDFLSSWDLQARYSHLLKAGRANLLDGFAISRTFSTEYIRGSLRIFPMHWSIQQVLKNVTILNWTSTHSIFLEIMLMIFFSRIKHICFDDFCNNFSCIFNSKEIIFKHKESKSQYSDY